ncbi:MAG: hypothetical protein IJS02_02375, partial [Bacteroidales bacterium]|nr:hypothetical protein [Bacteroidales bacterium]
MKNIYFIKTESYPDSLFVYPCKDSNGNHLANRTVAIFDGENTVKAEWFTGHGALTVVNPDDEEMAKAEVAVVMPNYGRSYYEVLDYYFQILQKLVRSMKEKQ